MKLTCEKIRMVEEYQIIIEGDSSYSGTIYFIDGVFSRVDFFAKNPYSRDEWRLLSFIEKQITLIESRGSSEKGLDANGRNDSKDKARSGNGRK